MKNGFDINKIHGDGYLIIPISMARIATGQSPDNVYEIVDYFASKLTTFGNDVVFLYTSGLYFNAQELSYEQREKFNQQVIDHSNRLRKLIAKNKKYVPGAFHYIPIDYVILNSPSYHEFYTILKKQEKNNPDFRKAIQKDIGAREYSQAHVNFILEEVAVTHILRQRIVELPRTLVKNDIWRLVVYPGSPIHADKFQYEHKFLSSPDNVNPFRAGQYDFSKKKLYLFEE